MKKRWKLSIGLSTILFALGGATLAGVTFASAYKSPSESKSFAFGSMDVSDNNFRALADYFAGGEGTPASPYLISNSLHLRNLSKLQNSGLLPSGLHFKLSTSFQYEGEAMRPIGYWASSSDMKPFLGTFDGDGHTIYGLKIVGSSSDKRLGLFGQVGKSETAATVKNLVLSAPSVTIASSSGTPYAGFAVGYLLSASSCSHVAVYGGTTSYSTPRAKFVNSSSLTVNTYGIVGNAAGTSCGFLATLDNAIYSGSDNYSTWTVVPSGSTTIASGETKSIYNNAGTVTGF